MPIRAEDGRDRFVATVSNELTEDAYFSSLGKDVVPPGVHLYDDGFLEMHDLVAVGVTLPLGGEGVAVQ